MKKGKIFIIALCVMLSTISCKQNTPQETPADHKAQHAGINTPDDAIAALKDGNKRFLDGKLSNTDYKEQVEETKGDQHPHSIILSCMDSRVPPEIIFDQGIGNIFVTRVAGNIEDADILGSMEYAVKVKGSKLILVMGHENCGAVKGSIDNVQLGNLTQLVEHIKPAITGDTTDKKQMLEATIRNNVKLTIAHILQKSDVISELVKENKVKIVGAYYHISTGQVDFME